MAEILLSRLVVYPVIYRVSYIPGGARFQPSTVCQKGTFVKIEKSHNSDNPTSSLPKMVVWKLLSLWESLFVSFWEGNLF